MASVGSGEPKWKGKASAEVEKVKAEEVWTLLADFCNLHKWFPTLTTCVNVEGKNGEPGCVRLCSGFKNHIVHSNPNHVNWTKQKLLSIDPGMMTLSYSVIDGNIGFNSYVAKMSVMPKDNGCTIKWAYEVEPVEGWKSSDLDEFIGNGLNVMSSRMKEALRPDVVN